MGDTLPDNDCATSASARRSRRRSDTVKKRDGSLGSGSSTGEKVLEDANRARSGDSVVDQKVVETLSAGKSFAKDNEEPKLDSEVMDGKASSASLSCADGKDKDSQSSLLEKRETFVKPRNDDKKLESRTDASEAEARNLSSGAEIRGPNQRPAAAGVICDFYAKGWCIKGSSCRFLHIKDDQKNNLSPVERGVAADCKRDIHHEGLVEHGQGSRPPNQFSEIKRQSGSTNNYGDHGSPIHRDGSLISEKFHSEYAVSSSHKFRNPYSQSRVAEELSSFQHLHPHSYRYQSLTRDSSNSSSSVSVSAAGALSSNSISAWTGSSLPFSYSSISTTGLDSISSSLLNCSSNFPGSKPDNLLPAKRKISSNDWEPSIPFRPSFLIRSMISLPDSLYDPLRDSVDLPKVGDASLRPSFNSQGSSIENVSKHQNNGETVLGTRGLACNDDTMSLSSHNTNFGKDTKTAEVEVVGTSTGLDYRNTRDQENSLGASAVKDITEATSDIRQNQGCGNSLVSKVDSIRQNNQMDAGHNLDQSANKDSRELRQFRAVLIEFVKELLKPKWRDGHLSKAAHNKIVKKAVEKVLGTLPLEQVPTSVESAQQYIAAARGKIDKLVEGYTEIYGKV